MNEFNVDQDLKYSQFNLYFKYAIYKPFRWTDDDKDYDLVKPKKPRNLFIYGECGVGKTYFLQKIMKKQFNRLVVVATIINFQEWIQRIMDSWKSYDFNYTSVNDLVNKRILLIDDLGAEVINQATAKYIYDLFDKRFKKSQKDESYLTIITSNYSLKELEKKYELILGKVESQRIFSRVKGIIANEIKFLGQDKRIKKPN